MKAVRVAVLEEATNFATYTIRCDSLCQFGIIATQRGMRDAPLLLDGYSHYGAPRRSRDPC